MKKYFLISQTVFKEYFTYRLNFILWRLRNLVSLFIPIFLWQAVLTKNQSLQNQTLTYFLIIHLVSSLIASSTTSEIASIIQNGEIINLLLKPVSFFKYYFFRDLADKTLNFSFAIFEVLIVAWLIKFSFFSFIHFNIYKVIIFIYFLTLALFLNFFVSMLLSFIGFISPEVWAPRFIFMILLQVASGLFIPLDFLPKPIFNTLIFTPFFYFFYLPTKIIVSNQLNFDINLAIFSGGFWVLIFFIILKFSFQKGLKTFSFWGK
ncbi:MAG: ABC-2 family transporter protein [Candidatus Microgenomates bacterium]